MDFNTFNNLPEKERLQKQFNEVSERFLTHINKAMLTTDLVTIEITEWRYEQAIVLQKHLMQHIKNAKDLSLFAEHLKHEISKL